jgi:hypothetical protein
MRSTLLAVLVSALFALSAFAEDGAAPTAPAATPGAPAAPPSAPGGAPAAGAPAAPSEKPAGKPADVAVITLREAVAAGKVKAWGTEPQSFRAVRLHLRNRTQEPQAIDIAGSYLEPKTRRRYQRLGLGPAVTPSETRRPTPGTVIVDLAPGAEIDLVVQTCCLDAGLPSPNKNEYEASDEKLPEVRWWAEHPSAPQIDVNSAIWDFAPEVELRPGVVPDYERPSGRFVAVHRGMLWRLHDGVLTTVDAEGVERILGAGVFQVLPTDDGTYAVRLGPDRLPQICLVPTTAEERWKAVADLDGSNRIRDVVSAGGGNLVLVTDKGVAWWDASSKKMRMSLGSEQQDFLSVRRASATRLHVTLRKPARPGVQQGGDERLKSGPRFELWNLDLATGEATEAEKFWNVGAMLAGAPGVFALSHTQGKLRHLVGDKFQDVGGEGDYRRILAVAGDLVWLTDAEDKILAADAKSGAVRIRTTLRASTIASFDADPVTGDLACVIEDSFRWIHAADGREETVSGGP